MKRVDGMKNVQVPGLITIMVLCSIIVSTGAMEAAGSGQVPLTAFSGGSGTAGDPYVIKNAWELQNMNQDCAAHYALGNDIDAGFTAGWHSGAGFVPVGTEANKFTGSLNGRGFTITGLHIRRPDMNHVGLFGYLGTGGMVGNVGLVDISVKGNDWVGGLAGYHWGNSVANSYATGTVNGASNVGGLIGYNRGTVSESYAAATVLSSYNRAGGLVGYNRDGNIAACHATGTVSGVTNVGGFVGYNDMGTIITSYAVGNVGGEQWVGGFAGYNLRGTLAKSYSTGSVTRPSGAETEIGGFVGSNLGGINNCYSAGRVVYLDGPDPTDKGFAGAVVIGSNYVMASNFWDMEASGQTLTAGHAAGETTDAMRAMSTFTGADWDFEEVWYMEEGVSYPMLQWQDGTDSNGIPDGVDAGEETPGFSPMAVLAAAVIAFALVRMCRRQGR